MPDQSPQLSGAAQPHRSLNEPELSGARPHVLIIDDEFFEYVKIYLERHNFRVTYEANPETALQMLATLRIDILLCDLLFTPLGGAETLRRARQIPHLAHTPMFIWSHGGVRPDDAWIVENNIQLMEKSGNIDWMIYAFKQALGYEVPDEPPRRPNTFGSLRGQRSLVSSSAKKTTSIVRSNRRAILKASGRLVSYFSASLALLICRDTA